MFGAEAAAELCHQVMHGTSQRRLTPEEVVARSAFALVEVEVQVAVPGVTVGDQIALRGQSRADLLPLPDEVRQCRHRHADVIDRKSTRLNSSHVKTSY